MLAYYASANASAWTLAPDEGRPARIIPVVGLAGCLVLAFAVPASSVPAPWCWPPEPLRTGYVAR
ncbi:hypothetical protein ADK53_32925 [Streptomyces sp. WM6373]|nr:hypothetical protein ADK53_32925 [Streptomyces sp. WM6373]